MRSQNLYHGMRAINAFRGIRERSYGKILKYLHMLREANPGTHSSYEIDNTGRFRYLFIAFGQSIRGFNRVMSMILENRVGIERLKEDYRRLMGDL